MRQERIRTKRSKRIGTVHIMEGACSRLCFSWEMSKKVTPTCTRRHTYTQKHKHVRVRAGSGEYLVNLWSTWYPYVGKFWHAELATTPPSSLSHTPPCVHSTRPSECRHHAHMFKHVRVVLVHTGTFRTCTRGRDEWTHGGFPTCHTTTPQHSPHDTRHKTQHNTTRQHHSTAHHNTTTHHHKRHTHTQHNATPPQPHTTHINPVPVQCILASQQFYNFCELFNFCSYRFQFHFAIICLYSYSFFPELILRKSSVEGYDENVDCGCLGQKTVASNFGHWITGEDLSEGHSWTLGVVLLDTVGVGLLSCVCVVFDLHLPTRNVNVTREPKVAWQTRDPTLRSVRIKIINKPKIWSLSRCSGDQMEAADDVEQAEFVWHVGAVLAVHCHHERERLPNSRVVVGFGWTTSSDDYWYQSKVSSGSRNGMPSCKISWSSWWGGRMETATLYTRRAPEERLMELSTFVGCGGSPTPPGVFDGDRDNVSSDHEGEAQCGMMVVTQLKLCHEMDETARVHRLRCRAPSEARLKQVVP